MIPQDFYEMYRNKGLTDNITQAEPDYSLPFYQEIFNLMDGYARCLDDENESQDIEFPDYFPDADLKFEQKGDR